MRNSTFTDIFGDTKFLVWEAIVFYKMAGLVFLFCDIHRVNMSTLFIVKLRQGSGKEGQGMALKAKGLKACTLA